MATRNLSIMFTDIKGFTARTSGETRLGMAQFLNRHERLLVPVFRYFKGTIVKTIGDAFLVYFESPTDAVLCGVTIQEVLRQHNANRKEEERLEVRVAINVGDVELMEKDILGEAVNIAARLEGIAEAGEVFFTEAVYQTMNRKEAPSAEVGERIFKGIPHPIRVYKVINDPNSVLAQALTASVNLSDSGPVIKGIHHDDSITKGTSPVIKGVIALLLFCILSLLIWILLPSQNEKTLEQAQQLIEKKAFGAALTAVDPALRSQPMHEELLTQAERAGRGHLQTLTEAGQYQQAMIWLKKALKEKPYLEPLRSELPVLDTKATIIALTTEPKYKNQYYPKPLKDLLTRYPQNIEVRYTGGKALEDKWLAVSTLWYYDEALNMGKTPNDHIFTYCIKHLEKYNSNNIAQQRAHEILQKYYPTRRLDWAKQALNTSGVRGLRNAWIILSEEKDPLLEIPYYHNIFQLLKNSPDFDPELRSLLAEQTTLERRNHIIALHQELISTYPRFINYGNRRDTLIQNLQQLKQEWANK